MRFWKEISLLGVVLVLAFAPPALHKYYHNPVPKLPGSVVKLMIAEGHGSGVHIGGGYVLTAAHVVGDEKELKLKTDTGGEGTAEVIWSSKVYDVALVHTENPLARSFISCRNTPNGTPVEARGNPADQEFVSTWGKIGGQKAIGESPWRIVEVVSMTIVPGMSGGGLFDENGSLIGILVGVMARSSLIGMNLTGIGYVVPMQAICGMLGR